MTKITQLTAQKIQTIRRRITEIDGATGRVRQQGGFRNLADIWVLERERRQLQKTLAKLEAGGNNICPYCGGPKMHKARSCKYCRGNIIDEAGESRALAAFNSLESKKIRSDYIPRKYVDRCLRAFQRWRRWRRRAICAVTTPNFGSGAVCACGGHKPLKAKRCDACKDAKHIFRQRMPPSKFKKEEAQVKFKREPRIVRLLTPSMYETDTSNAWDDLVRLFEDNR